MAKAKKEIRVVSAGVSSYPHLNKPDTKFDPDGHYKTDVKYDAEVGQEEVDAIEAAIEARIKQEKKTAKDPKKVKRSQFDPFSIDEDTGEVTLRFKINALGKNSKTGETWENKPVIMDAAGKPTKKLVTGGSLIQVQYQLDTYFNPLQGVGATLKPKAVVVDEFRESMDAESMGFQINKDYEADDEDTSDETDLVEDTEDDDHDF